MDKTFLLGNLVDMRVVRADYRAFVANDVLNDGRTDACVTLVETEQSTDLNWLSTTRPEGLTTRYGDL